MNGRGERIRTSDLSVPNRAHYQAVLLPEICQRMFDRQGILEALEIKGQAVVNNSVKNALAKANDLAR